MAHTLPPDFAVTFTNTLHSQLCSSTTPSNNPPPYTPFNVIVTGAGKGLGRDIALAYARSGVTGICISSRTKSDLTTLKQDLLTEGKEGLKVLEYVCDTSDANAVREMAKACEAEFCVDGGGVDVVIANAGVISKYLDDDDDEKRRLPVGIVEDDDFERVTAINYLGSYYVAKYFTLLLLKGSDSDNINGSSTTKLATAEKIRAFVVISSLAGHSPRSAVTSVAYNVSKLANNRMVEHMANDHGAQGLLAYSVHPGEVVTPQTLRHSTKKGDMWDSSKSSYSPVFCNY